MKLIVDPYGHTCTCNYISTMLTGHVDSRQALLWVCDYIKHQSSREHPQHNRDLHTTIVAAFSTILTWINAHPYLMGTKVQRSTGWLSLVPKPSQLFQYITCTCRKVGNIEKLGGPVDKARLAGWLALVVSLVVYG